MARLVKSSFKKINKERHSVHEPVAAGYMSFSYDDKMFFQIDTYGTISRQEPGKLSQSIQVDKEMAELLISELQKTFKL